MKRAGRTVEMVRDYEVAARKNAMRAARRVLAENISIEKAGIECSAPRSTVTMAIYIICYGTEEEIAAVEGGSTSIANTEKQISRRRKPGQGTRRAPPHSKQRTEELTFDSEVFGRLRDAFAGIIGMPLPRDVADLVKRNNQRVIFIDRNLLTILDWITEFSNAYTK